MEVEEFQRGCSPTILSERINDKDALAAKYDLELVAGTFFRVPFSPTYGTGIEFAQFPKYMYQKMWWYSWISNELKDEPSPIGK